MNGKSPFSLTRTFLTIRIPPCTALTLDLATGKARQIDYQPRPPAQSQVTFQAFLRELRRHYRGSPIYLLLDAFSSHTALRTQALAAQLDIHLLWLPKQHSELNPLDQFYKELKDKLVANRQFKTMKQEVAAAQAWIEHWTDRQTLRKAGQLSKNCWLRKVCKNFCIPT